jgi:hypothetical protein
LNGLKKTCCVISYSLRCSRRDGDNETAKRSGKSGKLARRFAGSRQSPQRASARVLRNTMEHRTQRRVNTQLGGNQCPVEPVSFTLERKIAHSRALLALTGEHPGRNEDGRKPARG